MVIVLIILRPPLSYKNIINKQLDDTNRMDHSDVTMTSSQVVQSQRKLSLRKEHYSFHSNFAFTMSCCSRCIHMLLRMPLSGIISSGSPFHNTTLSHLYIQSFIHSVSQSGYFYSASSSPLTICRPTGLPRLVLTSFTFSS